MSHARGVAAAAHRRSDAYRVARYFGGSTVSTSDSSLRRHPWRVEISDSTSAAYISAALSIAAALGARPRTADDQQQLVFELENYVQDDSTQRLQFSIAAIVRCGATWDSVSASMQSYEAFGRRLGRMWVPLQPIEGMHGAPTVCLERPDFDVDRPRRPPSNEELKLTASRAVWLSHSHSAPQRNSGALGGPMAIGTLT